MSRQEFSRRRTAVNCISAALLIIGMGVPTVMAPTAIAQVNEQEEAYKDFQAGKIKSFPEIRMVAEKQVDGELIGTEYIRNEGRAMFVYRLTYRLTGSASTVHVDVDAKAGKVLQVKGK